MYKQSGMSFRKHTHRKLYLYLGATIVFIIGATIAVVINLDSISIRLDISRVISASEDSILDEDISSATQNLLESDGPVEELITSVVLSNSCNYTASKVLISVLLDRNNEKAQSALFEILANYEGDDVEWILLRIAEPLNDIVVTDNPRTTLLSKMLFEQVKTNSIDEYRAVALGTLFDDNVEDFYDMLIHIGQTTTRGDVARALDAAAIQSDKKTATLIYQALNENSNGQFSEHASKRLRELNAPVRE